MHTIYLADLLVTYYLAGQEIERLNTDDMAGSLQFLDLPSAEITTIIGSIPWADLQSGNWQSV